MQTRLVDPQNKPFEWRITSCVPQFVTVTHVLFLLSLQGKCTVCDGRDDLKEYSNIRSAMKVEPDWTVGPPPSAGFWWMFWFLLFAHRCWCSRTRRTGRFLNFLLQSYTWATCNMKVNWIHTIRTIWHENQSLYNTVWWSHNYLYMMSNRASLTCYFLFWMLTVKENVWFERQESGVVSKVGCGHLWRVR